MSTKHKTRAPAAFRLDQSGSIEFADEAANTAVPVLVPVSKRARRRPWGTMCVTAFAGLLTFAIGIWAYDTIISLFSRQDWLGWVALGLASMATLGALGWLAREVFALVRLKRLGALRDMATHAHSSNIAAKRLTGGMSALYASRPELRLALEELSAHDREIIDPADRIILTERLLLAPLDAQARQMVANTAKRVSVVTAVSPAAIIDLGFVAFAHLGLIRRLAELYGGRPGFFALLRLSRRIVTHLAITGGIALGDGLLQQVLGHGLAARLSARLGEGVLNGILATRVGIAAIEVCRPMPFAALPKPGVAELAAALGAGQDKGTKSQQGPIKT